MEWVFKSDRNIIMQKKSTSYKRSAMKIQTTLEQRLLNSLHNKPDTTVPAALSENGQSAVMLMARMTKNS